MSALLMRTWPLFLGIFLLMIGNGLQGTLLGLRADVEGFTTLQISMVMSAYFAGFLGGSKFTPILIQNVGHVRVFAALGSMISAILILYPALVHPAAWIFGRLVIGFCFCGVYITAESWLNDAADNDNRGQALSFYMIVQMAGIVSAQYIVSLGDVSGYILFIIPSVLVSLAFAPVLLSKRPSPNFETTKPMPLRTLFEASPLACVGMVVLGGVFATQFGMSAVFGQRAGLSVSEISLFISGIYIAALFSQYPIGWLSDRMDRRLLILIVAAVGGFGCFIALMASDNFWALMISGALVGGTSNPLYALLIAYANDYLEKEDMAAASGGLLFINGTGAVFGPLILGWGMDRYGPNGYWVFLAVLMLGLSAYGVFRMFRRPRTEIIEGENVPYAPISASTTPMIAEVAQEVYIEAEETIELEKDDRAETVA